MNEHTPFNRGSNIGENLQGLSINQTTLGQPLTPSRQPFDTTQERFLDSDQVQFLASEQISVSASLHLLIYTWLRFLL